jgi:hypothetical protein
VTRTATATATATTTPTPVIYGANDGFNRADDAISLGRADSTQAWDTDGSQWGVCGGRACVVQPAAGSVANYARLETNLTDVRAAVTISRSSSGSAAQSALVLRVAPDWATYILYVGLDATGLVDVWELVGGTWNQISETQSVYDASSDRRLEARVIGQGLDVLVDGHVVVSGVGVRAAVGGATRAGVFADMTDGQADWSRFDDFVVERWP